MIVTYFRSSSINAIDFCEQRYFIEYCLGIKGLSNAAATRGTIVHKVLEIMALQKMAIQQNQVEDVYESETKQIFGIKESPQSILKKVYPIISSKDTHIEWSVKDYDACSILVDKAITHDNGRFSPWNQNIVNPETKFDISLEKYPWSFFNYPKLGIKGHLSIRGTIDLIIQNEDGSYECIDYKTGRSKWDWNKGKEKSFNDFLLSDQQFILYFFALKMMNPDKEYLFTVYYIQSGEAITIPFDDKTMKIAEKMLQDKFNRIRNNFRPRIIYPNFKCKFCSYAKYSTNNEPVDDYNKSACKEISTELQQIGMEKVFNKRCQDKTFSSYTGGGRSQNGQK